MATAIHTCLLLVFVTNVFGAKFIFPDHPLYSKLLSRTRLSIRAVGDHMTESKSERTNDNKVQLSNTLSTQNVPPTPNISIAELSNLIANSVNQLGLQIDTAITVENSNGIFSPLNIAEAILLLWLGSNGATFNEISQVMKFQNKSLDIQHHSQSIHEQFGQMLELFENSKNDDQPRLTTASGLFVQNGYPIGQTFKQIATNSYKSEIKYLNFSQNSLEAQKTINDWVCNKTNGLITNILTTPPPQQTKVMLATALYFKGAWENPFPTELTHRAAFYPNGRTNHTSAVMVDMMGNFALFKYGYNKELDSEILGIPYKGNTVTMFIIAPRKSSISKLKEVQQKLTTESIDELIEGVKSIEMGVLMPKMEYESTVSLSSTLHQLGLKSLFSQNTSNLNVLSPGYPNTITQTIDEIRNMTTEKSELFVEEIIHKVYININEMGTEAAAITNLLIPRGAMKKMVLNQPFLFFIRHHQTNLNLFWGTVNVPTPTFT